MARSEQLKNFLRYVCELEIDGRGREIKEHSIGTEALSRPASYSPANDSSVRRRAFELRSKLEEIYRTELSAGTVRIELPKGSYVPVFGHWAPTEAPLRPEGPPSVIAETPKRSGAHWPSVGAALVVGVVLGIAGMRLVNQPNSTNEVLREAWGPLATQSDVLICLGTPFQMTVRAGGFSPDADLPVFPAPTGIEGLFDKTAPRRDGAKLFMRPALNTTTLGALGAVVAASNRLQTFGVQSQILPERTAPLASFRNRNVILVGDPLTSFAASQLLNSSRLTIALDPTTKRMAIRDRTLPSGSAPVFTRASAQFGATEVFGLLTVRPTDAAPGQHRRTLIVTGLSNVGVQGAMEFFASPERMRDLKQRLQKEGQPGFPDSYQVVVRCSAQDSLPLTCEYAAHYVLGK